MSQPTPDEEGSSINDTIEEGTPVDEDNSGSSEDRQEADPFNIPTPSTIWRFNSFLLDLENEINNDELRKLKEMFRGEIGHAVLQETTTATELFRLLRQRLFLSRDNLLYLQHILMKLQRPDLNQLALQYARDEGDCIHFYPASDQPENGYRFVKFHVEGKDFTSCRRRDLMALRDKVSQILLIPPQYVLIAGVEPSSSMLITLMIPEQYVRALETLLRDYPTDVQELSDLGIDTIAIDDQVHNIHGVTDAEVVATEQQSKLVNVYQQLQTKTKQLEDCEIQCMKLSRRIKTFEKQQSHDHMESQMLRKMFVEVNQPTSVSDENKPTSLSSQSSLVHFKDSLRKIEDRGYDKGLIGMLLAANTDVVVTRMRDAHRITTLQLQLVIQDLQSRMIPQQLELERLRFQGRLEMVLMDVLQMLKQTFKVNIELPPWALTTLRKLTQKLRDRERKRLMKTYEWSDSEKLKIAMDDDPDLLLACLYLKEVEKTQQQVDFNKFISSCLQEVGRSDLKKKFLDMVKHAPMPPRPESAPMPTPAGSFKKPKRNGSLPRDIRKSSVTDDQQQIPPGQYVDMAKMASQVDDIHTAVGRIDDTVKKAQVGIDDVFKEPMSAFYGTPSLSGMA